MVEQRDFGGLCQVLYEDVFLVGLLIVCFRLSVVGYLLSVLGLFFVSVWYQELLEIKINWDK